MTLQVERSELYALYSMAQELAPLGVDYFAAWQRHLGVLEEQRLGRGKDIDLSQDFTFVNAPWDILLSRPTVYVTMHFDTKFMAGIGRLARQLRANGLDRPLRAIVGGVSDDTVYRKINKNEGTALADEYDIETVGVEDADFSAKVLDTMQRRGSLVAAIDANQGTSEVYSAPFLSYELEVRTGLFKLAKACNARVQPFIVESDPARIYLGPGFDARTVGVKNAIDGSVRFMGQHILRAPDKWLHWRYAMMLTSITHSNGNLPAADAPVRWVVSEDGGRIGLDLDNLRLFELDDATYADLVKEDAVAL